MSEYSEILFEVDDPVATITLNRPAALNAWTGRMDGEIRDAVERAAADRRVVGIVITGAGRAFCAGADLSGLDSMSSGGAGGGSGSLVDPTPAAEAGTPEAFNGRFSYLMAIDKPVIAAVNGAVAGMAFPFALCCDLRVVSPNAVFLSAFPQRGLIAEFGLSWLLPRLVGPGAALDILMTSRRVSGEEAKQLGLAEYLVEDHDDLLPFCRRYVERLATTVSPASMAVMKRQVYSQLHAGQLAAGLAAAEVDADTKMRESFTRPDFREGVRSFLDKRQPEFPRIGD